MLVKSLFATTALVSLTWLATAAAPANPAQRNGAVDAATFPTADKNRAYLCNYGYEVTYKTSYSSGSSASSWTWNIAAVPIVGTGKIVKEIVVADQGYSSVGYGFSVGIYPNDSKKNSPGKKLIVGASATTSGIGCAQITIPIPPTLLKAGKIYWIEEIAGGTAQAAALWVSDKSQPNQGLSHLKYCNRNGYCEHEPPWQAIPGSYQPYVRVK